MTGNHHILTAEEAVSPKLPMLVSTREYQRIIRELMAEAKRLRRQRNKALKIARAARDRGEQMACMEILDFWDGVFLPIEEGNAEAWTSKIHQANMHMSVTIVGDEEAIRASLKAQARKS